MTAVLLFYGVVGYSELAADIGIVQGATLALFYAFSANARNLILAARTSAPDVAARLLATRLWLGLPLAGLAFVLGVKIAGAAASVAVLLVMRRVTEWVGEIAIALNEAAGRLASGRRTVVAEGVALALATLLPLASDVPFVIAALPWALTPLVALFRASLSVGRAGRGGMAALLPHFGSTAVIGVSVYVFRLSIALLAGKALAGSLFTAFAIGGLVPTIFGQALAPTLLHRAGEGAMRGRLLWVSAALMVAGSALATAALAVPDWLPNIGGQALFWPAAGLSIAGGGVMLVATAMRARLIHRDGRHEVFGPDLLANILIATGVPFVYYVFGVQALAGLYLLSALLGFAFLWGASRAFLSEVRNTPRLLDAVAAALVLPVFFQIGGGLFDAPAVVFDAAGDITRLPLPISVAAVFAGIAMLGRYAVATRSLITVFFTALLFVMTALVAADGASASQGAKLVLLAQYLLPMFALILGEMYGHAEVPSNFERVALWVLLPVLSLQLLASWMAAATFAQPKVFVFSIYQHLQYFPMIVAALMTMIAFSAFSSASPLNRFALVLLPLASIHLAASMSISAGAFAGAGLIAITCFFWRGPNSIAVTAASAAACALGLLYVWVASTGVLADLFGQTGWQFGWGTKFGDQLANILPGASERITYWAYYAQGVFDSVEHFLFGHAVPPDRSQFPSAHNYWLDVLYNFGAFALLPIGVLLAMTGRALWRSRRVLLARAPLAGTAVAAAYLLLGESMLKVGMRQPYPGIITFFIWGLLLARLDRAAAPPSDGVLR